MSSQTASADKFPVLRALLEAYFVDRDAGVEFVARYHKHGESSAEFTGVADELRYAIKHPREATPVVNELLGLDLSVSDMRSTLSDLLDQMTQQGDYDPANVTADEPEEEGPSTEEVMDYWLLRRITLPIKPLRDKPIPLWLLLVVALGIFLIGLGLGSLQLPSALAWLPLLLQGLGIVATLAIGGGMLTLRREITHPTTPDLVDEPQNRGWFRRRLR